MTTFQFLNLIALRMFAFFIHRKLKQPSLKPKHKLLFSSYLNNDPDFSKIVIMDFFLSGFLVSIINIFLKDRGVHLKSRLLGTQTTWNSFSDYKDTILDQCLKIYLIKSPTHNHYIHYFFSVCRDKLLYKRITIFFFFS